MRLLGPRNLFFICMASACWAFSFGIGSQVVTHWVKNLGASDTVVGFCHSFYYFGLAAGSCAVPWLTRRLGPTPCAAFGLIASGMTLVWFPALTEVWCWYAIRFLNGWAGAMCVVPLETIISRDSAAEVKTRNFAFYGVSITVGGAIGIAVGLTLTSVGATFPFWLGASLPITASALVFIGMRQHPARAEAHEQTNSLQWVNNFLSYGTAWCQGFLEGGMLAFLSLFLIARGFSADQAGVFMGVTMVGVILFQVPVAWLADRYGRTPILLGCYSVVALTLLAIPWLSDPIVLAVGLFCFGACTGAMYPLGLAMLGDRIPEVGLARAYAWYLAIECVGSQLGAATMGTARDLWGQTSMFAVGLASVLLVLIVWCVLRVTMRRREIQPASGSAAQPKQRQAA